MHVYAIVAFLQFRLRGLIGGTSRLTNPQSDMASVRDEAPTNVRAALRRGSQSVEGTLGPDWTERVPLEYYLRSETVQKRYC